MDIGSLSIAMSNISVRSSVDVSLMRMNMEGANQELDTVAKMMNDSAVVDPNLGKVIDIKV
jgi:hypothetical protein